MIFSNKLLRIVCFLSICLLLATPCYAFSPSDKTMGIGNDKWLHMGAGMAIDQALKPNKRISWLERKLIVTGVGTVKELTDPKFDVQDLGATVIGGLLSDLIVIRW